MLTGDKQETAIEIAFTCKLMTRLQHQVSPRTSRYPVSPFYSILFR